jgi:hypothetical protein
MDRKGWLVVTTVTVAVLSAGVLMLGSTGPASSNASGPTTPDTPSATPGGNDTTDAGPTSPTGGKWSFGIDSIESCGDTCRDVTATLDNTGTTTRTGVTVTTKVTADGELLWEGTETVGTLEPGESSTATRRVGVGYTGALAIEANDGYVTVETVVRWDGGTTTFEDRKQVA